MRRRFAGLWRHPDFLKLWAGETVSLFGSQVTMLALPLTAVLALGATPVEMGLLSAAGFAPFLLLTLFAGVWVDRHHRRPVMIWANAARALLLGTIPLGAALGALRMEYLYTVAFLAGCSQVLFELAYQSYVPAIVERAQLVEANGKLQSSASAAEISGPGVGGLLVQAVTAPFALLLDALSFLASAVSIALIRAPEPAIASREEHRGVPSEVGEGLGVIARNPYLRAIAGEATLYNLWGTGLETLFLLYATRELGLAPGVLGMIIALGGTGSLLGATLAGRAARRFGFGRATTGAYLFACGAPLLIPLAGGPSAVVVPWLIAAFFLTAVGVSSSQVYVLSLRQGITPARLLARMNAGYRFFVTGFIPVGALLAGVLGQRLGLRAALFVCALGTLGALLPVIFSPLPRLRKLPEVAEEPAAAVEERI